MRGLVHDPEGFKKPFCTGRCKTTFVRSTQHIVDADWLRRQKAMLGHVIPQSSLDLDSQLDNGYEREFACELLDGR